MIKVLVATVSALLLASTVGSGSALAEENVQVERLAGADRYATAAAVALDGWPNGSDVVLARGDDFPDGLAAAFLANPGPFPILLTEPGRLPAATLSALQELGSRHITIAGGVSAVSAEVERDLRARGFLTTRFGGTDRFDTAAAIAASRPENIYYDDNRQTHVAVLANGYRFADALAAGPMAAMQDFAIPILLTESNLIPNTTRQALLDRSIGHVLIVGGTAVVSDQVTDALTEMGVTFERVSGADRTATAAAVADLTHRYLGWSADHVNLVRGDAFPDALPAGPHGGAEQAPILLTTAPNVLGDATRDYLQRRRATIQSIDVFGDQTAVSDTVVEDARFAATTSG